MASTQLIRVSTRLSRNLISTSIRSIATQVLLNQRYCLQQQQQQPIFVHLNILNKRFYATESKFTKAQVEEKVLDILKNFDRVKENPAKPQVTLDSHLAKDLGLDSLDQVEVIVQLEDAFGYEIPDSEYERLNTPNEIVKYIQKRLAEI